MTTDTVEPRRKHAGVYRRHAQGCPGNGRCRCPYVVRWKNRVAARKQMFPTLDLARNVQG
jgi:hypothetical protein